MAAALGKLANLAGRRENRHTSGHVPIQAPPMNPTLPVAAFQFDYHAEQPGGLPAYAGSAWRGAFGHALKRTVCVVRDVACADCLLYRSCAYPYIFETPPPPGSAKLRHYTAAPHPFALAVGPDGAQTPYRLGVHLFGRGLQYLPYIIHALDKAGAHGLGKQRRAVFRLAEVSQQDGGGDWHRIFAPGLALSPRGPVVPTPPPVPKTLRIELQTPLRLRREDRAVTAPDFQFADLFSALLRRVSLLTYFHTDTPLETDFAGLTQAAKTVRLLAPDLVWWDWTRYSTRQQASMDMGGLLGGFGLDGAEIEAFWPYLWLGQWTLVGKAATMGLGRYRIHID